MSKENCLRKIQAIDQLQKHLEQLETDLIHHPRLNTEPNEILIALAYTDLKRALRLPEESLAEAPAAVFTLEEEKLGLPSHDHHAERAP